MYFAFKKRISLRSFLTTHKRKHLRELVETNEYLRLKPTLRILLDADDKQPQEFGIHMMYAFCAWEKSFFDICDQIYKSTEIAKETSYKEGYLRGIENGRKVQTVREE